MQTGIVSSAGSQPQLRSIVDNAASVSDRPTGIGSARHLGATHLLTALPPVLPLDERPGGPVMARAQTHEPETPMSREDFLAWVDQQPSGRFERIDGIVVAMAPERASHNLRKGTARDALRRGIREAALTSCQVFGDGMTVQVEGHQATCVLQAAVGAALPDRLARRAAHRAPLAHAERPGCHTGLRVRRNQARSSGDNGDCRGVLRRLSSARLP